MVQYHVVNQIPRIFKQQVQNNLTTPIVKPWEEIHNDKHETRIKYDKEVTFHIIYYSRPIHFHSLGFLQGDSNSLVAIQHLNVKWKHCHQVGHMENQCFDHHHCLHCGKTNHHSDKRKKRKKYKRKTIRYGWISS
jgi:hypothetical protein